MTLSEILALSERNVTFAGGVVETNVGLLAPNFVITTTIIIPDVLRASYIFTLDWSGLLICSVRFLPFAVSYLTTERSHPTNLERHSP